MTTKSQAMTSLVPSPRVPPSKKRSGEQSWALSWTYSQKVVKTNEIGRSLIIT